MPQITACKAFYKSRTQNEVSTLCQRLSPTPQWADAPIVSSNDKFFVTSFGPHIILLSQPPHNIILTQLQTNMQHSRAEQHPHPRPPAPSAHHPNHKNQYAGLTLKQYFNIPDSRHRLDEIDEENNSQVSAGTPCFGGDEEKGQKQRPYRKNRNKTELQDVLGSNQHDPQQKITQKMTTLSLEEFGNPKKNVVKLPSIHEQRQRSNSRQGLLKQTKELKPFQKRETVKARVQQNVGMNLALFLKKQELTKGTHTKNIINARRGIRSRVTSTSFYHMNLREKERDRVKTEQEIEPALEKSFIITRYGGMMRGQNREQLAGLKNYEQSFKLRK